jgi:hypothetical protein
MFYSQKKEEKKEEKKVEKKEEKKEEKALEKKEEKKAEKIIEKKEEKKIEPEPEKVGNLNFDLVAIFEEKYACNMCIFKFINECYENCSVTLCELINLAIINCKYVYMNSEILFYIGLLVYIQFIEVIHCAILEMLA